MSKNMKNLGEENIRFYANKEELSFSIEIPLEIIREYIEVNTKYLLKQMTDIVFSELSVSELESLLEDKKYE